MRKFLLYIIIVILGVVVVDIVGRFCFRSIFDNPRPKSKIAAMYRFVSCNDSAEIVFLGASKANHHYITRQVEDSLSVHAQNYGWNGSSIVHQYLSLLRAIDNGGLKVAILDISTAQIGNEWVKGRISDYWPYYWLNDTIRNIVNEIEGRDMSFLLCSSLIQYNSQFFNSFLNVEHNQGYTPLPYTGIYIHPFIPNDSAEEQKQKLKASTNPIAIACLQKMANICNSKGIKLIVCLSPNLENSQGQEQFLADICNQCGVEFWNMSTVIKDGSLFKNQNHLNDKGARVFTDYIINKLRQYI